MRKPIEKRLELEDVAEAAEEMANQLEELQMRYRDHPEMRPILGDQRWNARTIARWCKKLCKVRDFRGYRFGIIDENGEVREASKIEAFRLMTGCKEGNALELLRKWDVDSNGQWIERQQGPVTDSNS